jgi:hypothetical protein
MLTIQIQNQSLERRIAQLLEQDFDGDTEQMLNEFVDAYAASHERRKYSGILSWEKDGLTYQKELRSEWK